MSDQPKSKLGRPRDPERMRRVLEAAEQQFLEQGFERTSVEAVAKASGVSKMTIYSYFPTKKALFEAVIDKRVDAAFDFENAANLTPADPRAALTVIGRHFLGLIRADDVICKQRVLYAEAGVQQDACSAFFQQGPLNIVARVRAYLDGAVAAGSLELHDAEAGADQFLSLFLGTADIKAMLGLGKPTAEEDERLLERNVEMFMRAYGKH
ncbi:MAG: TetR/AcrR family transcriptional regulator [Methylococcaceae bacterium]|nr:TetR/AcrR family transcriptional regulator [Methylococcaceae bacterium]